MDEDVEYKIIRDLEYTKPFTENEMNLRSHWQAIHIVSKSCLDLFVPTRHGNAVQHSELKHGKDEPNNEKKRGNESLGAASSKRVGRAIRADSESESPAQTMKPNSGSTSESNERSDDVGFTHSANTGAFNTDDNSNSVSSQDGSNEKSAERNHVVRPSTKTRPPLVVFAYGGGWRRGDKETWRHYFSRWDTNFALATIVGRNGLYGNIGESFASRGFPCAVLSYPLVPTPFPINFVEITTSFIMTALFTLVVAALTTIAIDIPYYIVFSRPLICAQWMHLQNKSEYPFQTTTFAIILMSQILTLLIIVLRESYLNGQTKTSGDVKPIFLGSLAVVVPMLLCPFLSVDRAVTTLSISATAFVQYLVYHYQQLTTLEAQPPTADDSSAMAADSVNQARCIARALRWLVDYGRSTGQFDTDSIILIGHSAGGHLVSLVALDHGYLKDVGLSPEIIQGVITLSAVHDLHSINWGLFRHVYLKPAFGTDPAYWTRMSPISYAPAAATASVNKPRFLIISPENDFKFMIEDAKKMCDVLHTNGFEVKRAFFDGCNHFTMVEKFGRTRRHFGRTGSGGGKGWIPSDEERVCWEFAKTIMFNKSLRTA